MAEHFVPKKPGFVKQLNELVDEFEEHKALDDTRLSLLEQKVAELEEKLACDKPDCGAKSAGEPKAPAKRGRKPAAAKTSE